MAMLEHLMELQNLFIVEGMHLYPFLTHLKKRRELRKTLNIFHTYHCSRCVGFCSILSREPTCLKKLSHRPVEPEFYNDASFTGVICMQTNNCLDHEYSFLNHCYDILTFCLFSYLVFPGTLMVLPQGRTRSYPSA